MNWEKVVKELEAKGKDHAQKALNVYDEFGASNILCVEYRINSQMCLDLAQSLKKGLEK